MVAPGVRDRPRGGRGAGLIATGNIWVVQSCLADNGPSRGAVKIPANRSRGHSNAWRTGLWEGEAPAEPRTTWGIALSKRLGGSLALPLLCLLPTLCHVNGYK